MIGLTSRVDGEFGVVTEWWFAQEGFVKKFEEGALG